MQVWKFQLSLTDKSEIKMPRDAVVLHCAVQHGSVCLWAMVHPGNREETRCFAIVGTGFDVEGPVKRHLGTVLMHEGTLVLHVFEVEQ